LGNKGSGSKGSANKAPAAWGPECLKRRGINSPGDFALETSALSQKASSRDEAFAVFQKLYTLNEEPQPQVLFTFGFSNLKPAPSSVST
jgi:hypothetical protein